MAKQKRTKAKKSNNRRRIAPRAGHPREPAPLVLLDQTPFLKNAVTRCKRSISKLKRCRVEIERFETEDQPAFEAWKAREFGPLLTRLRETAEKVAAKMAFARDLEWACFQRGVPDAEAFEYVKRHQSDPDYRHPVYDAEEDTDDANTPEDDKEADEVDLDDLVRAFMKDFFGASFGDDEDGEDDEDEEWERIAGRRGTPAPEPTPPTAEERELKKLFRRLARRLHPDRNGEQSPIERERWNETLDAYHSGDLEALRALDAVCEVEGVAITRDLGLARLEDIRRHHELRFRDFSMKRRGLKRNPAWGFSRMTSKKLSTLRHEMHYEMSSDLGHMRHQLKSIEDMIASFQELGEKTKHKPTSDAIRAEEHPPAEDDWFEPKKRRPKTPPRSKKRAKPDQKQTEFSFA